MNFFALLTVHLTWKTIDAIAAIIADADKMCRDVEIVAGTVQETENRKLSLESMMDRSSEDVEAALKTWAAMSELGGKLQSVLASEA